MQVISFISRKGGTGKSTSALNIGASIKELHPQKDICFLDLDSQANLTLMCGEDTNHEYNAFTFIKQWRNDDNFNSLTDTSGIIHLEKYDLIPSRESLFALDRFSDLKPNALNHAIKNLDRYPDYFIIDTPAQFGVVIENTIKASDKIIIPVYADMLSMQGIIQTLDIINEYNATRKIGGVLVTRYNPRTNVQKIFMNEIRELASARGINVFDSTIRECNALRVATALQKDIFEHEPNSNGAIDYLNLTRELFDKGVIA